MVENDDCVTGSYRNIVNLLVTMTPLPHVEVRAGNICWALFHVCRWWKQYFYHHSKPTNISTDRYIWGHGHFLMLITHCACWRSHFWPRCHSGPAVPGSGPHLLCGLGRDMHISVLQTTFGPALVLCRDGFIEKYYYTWNFRCKRLIWNIHLLKKKKVNTAILWSQFCRPHMCQNELFVKNCKCKTEFKFWPRWTTLLTSRESE